VACSTSWARAACPVRTKAATASEMPTEVPKLRTSENSAAASVRRPRSSVAYMIETIDMKIRPMAQPCR
jgi:hypothetical protein